MIGVPKTAIHLRGHHGCDQWTFQCLLILKNLFRPLLLGEHHSAPFPWQIRSLTLLSQYWTCLIAYNFHFHPLARIPGPFLWRASRLPFIRSFLSGNLVTDVRKLHEKYGDIVRIAPDEVSFAHEDIWHDAFGRNPLPRNPTFFQTPRGQPDNLVMTASAVASARMRQVVMPAFTERALAKQESIMQTYTDLLMTGLLRQIHMSHSADNKAVINIVDWFNWFAFDLLGELGFGESFDSLRHTKHHPWVDMIFGSIKGTRHIFINPS